LTALAPEEVLIVDIVFVIAAVVFFALPTDAQRDGSVAMNRVVTTDGAWMPKLTKSTATAALANAPTSISTKWLMDKGQVPVEVNSAVY